jgi:rubrerythrin
MKTTQTSQVAGITRPGDNHTGINLNPQLAVEMIEGTREFGPTSSGGAELLAENRIRVARMSEAAATMPPSPDIPVERLPLLDKLGARLQFERTGVRLYDALISKLDAYGSFRGGPSRGDLEHIRDEEHRHLALAQQTILHLGGDPTVVTPCANIQAVASRGVMDIVVDPRTNLIECLDAVIVAELADHESWEQLASTISMIGDKQLEAKIVEAERTEAEHLVKVRGWMAAAAKLVTKQGD